METIFSYILLIGSAAAAVWIYINNKLSEAEHKARLLKFDNEVLREKLQKKILSDIERDIKSKPLEELVQRDSD